MNPLIQQIIGESDRETRTYTVTNPLVRQIVGEAAEDEFSAKDYLLSLPQEYNGYMLHISADPMAWEARAGMDRCLFYAQKLALMAKDQFPGIETEISLNPNTFPSRGIDSTVMEMLDDWLNDHFIEAIQAVEGV